MIFLDHGIRYVGCNSFGISAASDLGINIFMYMNPYKDTNTVELFFPWCNVRSRFEIFSHFQSCHHNLCTCYDRTPSSNCWPSRHRYGKYIQDYVPSIDGTIRYRFQVVV